jgi:RNA-directed DNA polymerase
MGHPGEESAGDEHAATSGLSTLAAKTGSHSEKQRQETPAGHSNDERSGMQTLHRLGLDPVAECQADPNSYGFRTERCTADAIEQCHTVLSNRAGARFVLEGDIQACYDRISHDWLLTHVPMDKQILAISFAHISCLGM